MPAKPAALTAETVDDDTQYSVTLKRAIEIGNLRLSKSRPAIMKGRIIKQHAEDIDGISALDR